MRNRPARLRAARGLANHHLVLSEGRRARDRGGDHRRQAPSLSTGRAARRLSGPLTDRARPRHSSTTVILRACATTSGSAGSRAPMPVAWPRRGGRIERAAQVERASEQRGERRHRRRCRGAQRLGELRKGRDADQAGHREPPVSSAPVAIPVAAGPPPSSSTRSPVCRPGG